MESLGLTIIRISDKRVNKEIGAVLEFLKAHDKFENYI
jgi:very-short-patch-repair endonuclease